MKKSADKSESVPTPTSAEKLIQLQVDVEKLVETGKSQAVDRIVEVLKEYEPEKAESCDFTFEELKPATLQFLAHIVYLSKNEMKYNLALPISCYKSKPNFQ